RLGGSEALLGLLLELRVAQKQRHRHRRAERHVIARRRGDAAMPDQLAIGADAAGQRLAQPGLVRAALRRRDRVAIGMAEAVLFVFWPHDGPLDAASPWATIREFGAAEKRLWR